MAQHSYRNITIEQEVHYVCTMYPEFADFLHERIQAGKIHGMNYTIAEGDIGIPCGCFYATLARQHSEPLRKDDRYGSTRIWKGTEMQRAITTHFGLDPDDYTPVELLIVDVRPGDTPEEMLALATLDALIAPYLS